MKNENNNDEAVSPVIATILMVAITVVLAGVLYVWASSLAADNTDGNFGIFSCSEVQLEGDSPTNATDDDLIRISMAQDTAKNGLNWAGIAVKITIGDGAPQNCNNPGKTGGTCTVVQHGDTTDNVWTAGDSITIKEDGSNDLCGGEASTPAPCDVLVTITDTTEGKTLLTLNTQTR